MFVPSQTGQAQAQAEAEADTMTLSDLPFQGYFVATSDYAVEGLLFEENQLFIYVNHQLLDDDPGHDHGHDDDDDDDYHVGHEAEDILGQDWLDTLEELHSFPHPDLKNYSESVRKRYLEELDLPYDLQAVYQEIAEQITPDMSQADIKRMIDNRVPGIYYTEKNDYQYYQIANPTVIMEGDSYQIHLFGEHLYTFESSDNQTMIQDQVGVTYDYIPGINPYWFRHKGAWSMKKYLTFTLSFLLASQVLLLNVLAEENDHHHDHGTSFANFIPDKILNPDDSDYVAPAETADYVGLYTAETAIDALGVDLTLLLRIQEDGLFNLAYYFENDADSQGLRFYANPAGEIEETSAIYQDLTLLTGALREIEDGLGSGLIRETLAPVVLLDETGQAQELYAYQEMAYGLRENYQNARVYQSVGLYISEDGQITIDVPHLIGLDTEEDLLVPFEASDQHEAELLVSTPTFELLQHNFDTYLEDHNDFRMAFDTPNDFVQKVLAMHLETNASFPQDTQVTSVDASLEDSDATYALLINEELLYAYDADNQKLYMATDFSQNDTNQYTANEWLTN